MRLILITAHPKNTPSLFGQAITIDTQIKVCMDKDLLYRFFEGRASVEEMRLVKEWSEASEENSKLLRRERKLFNAIILSGRFESSDGQA